VTSPTKKSETDQIFFDRIYSASYIYRGCQQLSSSIAWRAMTCQNSWFKGF